MSINKKLLTKILSVLFFIVTVLGVNVACAPQGDGTTYTLTFETYGGTEYEEMQVVSGIFINLPTPEKFGSEFLGWYETENFDGKMLGGSYMVSKDVTLYAKWNVSSYTVTFESNGGTEYKPVTVEGQKIQLPTPEKTDNVFMGWYDNPEFAGEALDGTYSPTVDVTLYAKWESNFIYFNFETNGGTKVESIKYRGEAVELSTPFKYGYKFEGWYDNSDLQGEAITSVEGFTESTTFYAKWSKITYLYMYYGTLADHMRYEYVKGDVVTIDELYSLFTPENLTVLDTLGLSHKVPFLHWAYEGETEATAVKVTDSIVIGDESIILVAQYDYSSVPAAANLTYDEKTQTYTTTGRVAHVFVDEGTPYGIFSMTLEFRKSAGGGVGPAIRMKMPNVSKQYESNCYYIAAGLCPSDDSNAKLQMSNVQNGWAHMTGSLSGGLANSEWGKYYAGLEANAMAIVTMKVVVTKNDIVVSVYDFGGNSTPEEVLYRYSDFYPNTSFMDSFEGTGFGLRSSTTGAKIYNINYEPMYEVEFDQAYGQNEKRLIKYDKLSTVVGKDSGALFQDENDKNTAYYDKFIGWSLTENGEIITEFHGGNKVYAVYEKVELHTVTFDGDNGEELNYAYFKDGEGLILPADNPFKNGENIDGVLKGYSFKEWQLNGETVTAGTAIKGDITVVAIYDVQNAYTVIFTADGVELQNAIVADGEIINLPVPEREGYRFDGWFSDRQFVNAYENNGVYANIEIFGKWVETVEITFVVNGEQVSVQTIDKGATATLPANPEGEVEVKDNGNLVTHSFVKWMNGNTVVNATTTFETNAQIVAEFEAIETRNGVVVTRDDNGNVISYRDTGFRVGSTGVSVEAYDFYEHISDYSKNSAYDVRYTLTIDQFVTSSAPEIRLMFMANPMGYYTEGTLGRLEIDGTGTQSAPFFNLYPASGRINFGGKVLGTSAQPVQGAIDIFAGSKYATYFKSLTTGKEWTLDVRFVHGIKEDGSVWFKFYIFDEILYTYGLTADVGTTNVVDGERVYGKMIQSSDLASHAKLQSYLLGNGGEIGGSHGIWTWVNLAPINGYTVTNIQNNAVDCVKFVNGTTTISKYLPVGSKITYELDNSEIYEDNGKRYYDEFKGWSLTENGEIITEVPGGCTLYAVYEKVEVTLGIYEISFSVDGNIVETSSVIENNAIGTLPIASKVGETKANGNILEYVFEGWYYDGNKIDANYVFTSNANVEARFNVIETRNGVKVTRDENGEIESYVITGNRATEQGIIFDEIGTQAGSGEVSYTVTFEKWANSSSKYVDFLYLVETDVLNYNGKDGQDAGFIRWNMNTGTFVFSSRIANKSNQAHTLTHGNVKACQYKSDYEAYKAGASLVLNVRIQYGIQADGEAWVKAYFNDCLLFVLGLTKAEIEAMGDSYYGGNLIGYTNNSAPADAAIATYDYLANPLGYYTGIWFWADISEHGTVTVTNMDYKPVHMVTYKVNGAVDHFEYVAGAQYINYELANGEIYEEDGKRYYNEFKGWSLTENGELVNEISADATLYAVYEKVEVVAQTFKVNFTVDGKIIESTEVVEGETISPLPTATKETITKENGNVVTYIFDGWYFENQKISETDTYAGDTVLVAKFIETETRNGMTLTYNQDGSVTYTHNDNTTGTIDDTVATDWTANKHYEITNTITYANWQKASGNYRMAFMVINEGMNFNGVSGEKTVWFNIQPSSGTVIFGTKINNSSKNNYQKGIGSISADCPYKVAYNSLVIGEKATFTFKVDIKLVETGTDASGNALYTANIKIYLSINGSDNALLYTYGYAEDSEGSNTVGGETVWGLICTDTNFGVDNTNFLAYLKNQPLENFGTKIGIWAWQNTSVNGGATITNVVKAIA